MNTKIFAYLFFLSSFFLLASTTIAVDLCSWRGYANKSGTLVNTTDYITVENAISGTATIFIDGRYTADVEGVPYSNITFKICGVSITQGQQNFTCPVNTLNTLNFSITSLSNGASCSYSCACSGAHCCSGATEYTSGGGTGTCQSSACAATTTTTSAGSGPGGGGTVGGTATTTAAATTTTTAAPVEETETVTTIENGTSATFNVTNSDTLKVESIIVEVKNTVNNVELTVKESSLPTGANLAISSDTGAVYKYLEITKTNVQDADISKVKIKFKVEKSWANSNNIDPATIALQRLVGNSWTKLSTTLVSEDSNYYYFEAESPGLSVFAVTGQKKPATTTVPPVTTTTTPITIQVPVVPTLPAYILLSLLIVLVAVVGFIFFRNRKKKSTLK